MKLRHGRHGGDAITAQLRQLLAVGGVYVDKAIHVANAEALHGVGGCLLPFGAEAD